MDLSDMIAIASGLLSAALWIASAFMNVSHGYDMDIEQNTAQKKTSMLNALAAICSAISIVSSNFEKISQLLRS